MECNRIVYLTEFDDRAELPETVIAQVEEYLLLGWAGARSKPQATTFDLLHLQVHTRVLAPSAITKMPLHRVLYVGTLPVYHIVFQGVIPSERRRLGFCQSWWESDGGTLTPLTCLIHVQMW